MIDSDNRIEALEKETAKKEFFEILKRQGYDLYDIDEETRIPKCLIPIIVKKDLNSFILFNNTLEHIHVQHDISVIEMCKYLMEDFFDEEQLLTLLQTNLYDALYLELRKKNGMVKEKVSRFLIK
jgi:hypothetical protein